MPKPSLATSPQPEKTEKQKKLEEEQKIEEDKILSQEEKNMNIMMKIPHKYKAHIAHEIDRLEYIDKRNGVRKKKTFTLPVEITNLILSNVLDKLESEKKRKSQLKRSPI